MRSYLQEPGCRITKDNYVTEVRG